MAVIQGVEPNRQEIVTCEFASLGSLKLCELVNLHFDTPFAPLICKGCALHFSSLVYCSSVSLQKVLKNIAFCLLVLYESIRFNAFV